MKSGHYHREKLLYVATLYGEMFLDLGCSVRDLRTLCQRIGREGVAFATKTLPVLDRALLQGLENGSLSCPSHFKRAKKCAFPAFCSSLWSKVFARDGSLLENPCGDSIASLRQIFGLVYKANEACKSSLEDATLSGFKSTEEELRRFHDENNPELYVQTAKHVERVFGSYCGNLAGKFGPGITADDRKPADPYGRYSHRPRGPHSSRISLVASKAGFLRTLPGNGTSDEFLRRTVPLDHVSLFSPQKTGNHATIILVPKDSRGPRIISCEPAAKQFEQQGLMRYMVTSLEEDRLTSGNINFTDQKVNQRLALESSVTGEWATLDLKDASDRISVRLVKKVFARCPHLLRDLLAVRSAHTRMPDGELLMLRKYAPMGSATCFPVLACCVYFMLVSALYGWHGSAAYRMVKVYGDDIIVPTRYYNLAVTLLENAGLKVNRSKSFHRGLFRESCGVDAYNGTNVTPVRYRATLGPVSKKDAGDLLSLVAAANALYERGLYRTSEFLFRRVEKVLGRLPYGSATSPYVCRVDTQMCENGIVMEVNSKLDGIRWKKVEQSRINLRGDYFTAWRVRTRTARLGETPYERLARTLPMMGLYDMNLPDFGVFDKPRSAFLVRGKFNHADC